MISFQPAWFYNTVSFRTKANCSGVMEVKISFGRSIAIRLTAEILEVEKRFTIT